MENDQVTDQERRRSFSVGHVVAIAALIGLIGFGLGVNADRLTVGLQQFSSQNEELPESLDYSSVDRVYQLLRDNYAGELDEDELMYGLKSGLVGATGDPFSEFLDADQAEALEQGLEGEFGGIGAEIGIRDEQLVVIAPLDGTPAAEAGLRPGDAIVAVDEEDTGRMSLQEAVNEIRGEEGTDVVLTIVQDGRSTEDITITRGLIEVPSVQTEILEGDIAHIELVRFGDQSAREFREAARQMLDEGAEQIVLDVRNNPGGYLDVAVDITSEFLETGDVIVEERRGEEVINTERAGNGGLLVGIPTVVLVNQGSASASEIIAGALRDQGAGTIVGEQSFGKGSVQQLLQAGNGNVLRVTIAQWYTPGGDNINELGIKPDEEVEMTDEHFDQDEDPQLERALEILR